MPLASTDSVRVQLSSQDLHVIVHGLTVAADRFTYDARAMRQEAATARAADRLSTALGYLRLADQFDHQTAETLTLRDAFASCEDGL